MLNSVWLLRKREVSILNPAAQDLHVENTPTLSPIQFVPFREFRGDTNQLSDHG